MTFVSGRFAGRFGGRVVVVTGEAGAGYGVAIDMAREGTAVVLMGHTHGTLGAVATQIEGFGEHGLVFISDVNKHRAAELHAF